MRPLILLLSAAVLFVGFMVLNHRRAAVQLDNETKVLQRVRQIAAGPGRETIEELGYRFAWVEEADLPTLLVAGPLVRGEGGVRWFATTDGREVFEFDTVIFTAHGAEPETGKLRRYLAHPASERGKQPRPPGWRLVE
ncbi:MAG: hypothetical protein ACYSUN_09920 [Planctomycetota bacterium]